MVESTKYHENMERIPFLKDYTSKIKSIKSEADEIITNKNYNLIDLKGIILLTFCMPE